MHKEIIIQNSHNNIMNRYKKILLILVLVLIIIITTIPFKKTITIMSIYKDSKFVIETSSPKKNKIIANNYLYINNVKCKYTINSVLGNKVILQINHLSPNFAENETIKLVLPTEEKPIIKYLYDYIRRTQ